MKILKQIHTILKQNGKSVKVSQKHDANLQKNSTLYFQIGLIICLLATYGVLEMKFLTKPTLIPSTVHDTDKDDLFVMTDYHIYQDQVESKVVKQSVKPRPIIDIINVLPDSPAIEDTPDVYTPDSSPPPIVKGGLNNNGNEKTKKDVVFNLNTVEKMPIFPGCESEATNEERKACFENKISKFIGRKFNSDIASHEGLKGLQKIFVQFKINKYGEVTDVKTRAPHPALEREALRVINKLPKMYPGMQGHVPVSVVYTLPISFQVIN